MSYLEQLERELKNAEKVLEQLKKNLSSNPSNLEKGEDEKIMKSVEEQVAFLRKSVNEEKKENSF